MEDIPRLSRPHRVRGRALILAVVALAAVLLGLVAARGLFQQAEPYRAASIYPQPLDVGAFDLKDADGNSFTESDLRGNLTLMFFGFTNCPDVCPDTLGTLAGAMDKLDTMRVATLPDVVFVSVDPARDAGDSMRDYVQYFDPSFRAVTGDDDALRALTSRLGIFYRLGEPDDSGYYAVDHSGMIVIVDDRGRAIGRFPPNTGPEALAADLFTLSRSRA